MFQNQVLTFLFFLTLPFASFGSSECGEFEFIGKIVKAKKGHQLLVYKGSQSEIKITLDKIGNDKWSFQVGGHSEGKVKILKARNPYHREGQIISSKLTVPRLIEKNRGDKFNLLSPAPCRP